MKFLKIKIRAYICPSYGMRVSTVENLACRYLLKSLQPRGRWNQLH